MQIDEDEDGDQQEDSDEGEPDLAEMEENEYEKYRL